MPVFNDKYGRTPTGIERRKEYFRLRQAARRNVARRHGENIAWAQEKARAEEVKREMDRIKVTRDPKPPTTEEILAGFKWVDEVDDRGVEP